MTETTELPEDIRRDIQALIDFAEANQRGLAIYTEVDLILRRGGLDTRWRRPVINALRDGAAKRGIPIHRP